MPSGMRAGSSINHTAEENVVWRSLRAQAVLRQKGLCYWCERPMDPPGLTPLAATLEHLKQRSEGGENTPENTAASCRECNLSRPAAEHVIARQRGLENNPRLLRAALTIANERWLEAVQARKEAHYAQQAAEPPLPEEYLGAERESVSFWVGRGVEVYRQGDAHRLQDSLSFLLYAKLLTHDEADAGRRYARLYLEAHEIRQPFLPPAEMMEWRLERAIMLRDIREHLFKGNKQVIAVMDDVCGKGEWIVTRYKSDYAKLAVLKRALADLAECIEMTFLPEKAA